MTVRAGADDSGWTEEQARDALKARPDLARRLDAGEPAAVAEFLALAPGVSVEAVRPL